MDSKFFQLYPILVIQILINWIFYSIDKEEISTHGLFDTDKNGVVNDEEIRVCNKSYQKSI